MKLVIIEPLGVEKDKLLSIARNALKDSVEIIYYDTKTTDTQELIERGKDAEIIVVANNPLNAEVINGCKKLKLLSVAFTGIDHIAMDACKANVLKKEKHASTKLGTSNKGPQTGDTSNLALWIALLFISGGAAVGTMVVSRKKKYNK